MIKKDLATYSNLEIVHFDSIDNALETIKLSPPLLILTEGRDGDKTALQLLETVKTDKNYRSIPIVVHSRAISSELKSAALRIGAHAVFHNPRDHKNLKIALTKLLKSAMDEGVTAGSDNSIRNKLKKITKLTPLLTLVQSVLEISNDPKSSAGQLAEVIKKIYPLPLES